MRLMFHNHMAVQVICEIDVTPVNKKTTEFIIHSTVYKQNTMSITGCDKVYI